MRYLVNNCLKAEDIEVQINYNHEKVLVGFIRSSKAHEYIPIWEVDWKEVETVVDTYFNKNIKTTRSIKRYNHKNIDKIKDLNKVIVLRGVYV